ncbi:MAG TPA: hypothetical protein VH251_11265 [Verrucomicrobiae bacterium]|nr:hypothetical protein [Verrucomicrobiae bacterium]
MFFGEVNFAARRFGLAALVTLGLPVAAQQPIQYSKPVDADPASKANGTMPDSALHDPANFNAPSPLFDARPGPSFDVLPGSSQPVLYNANALQWKKFLDGKKNWTLETPSEVLGIPTPEKILGVTDPNDDPSLSADDRFLKRRDQQVAFAATNGVHHADSLLWQKDDSSGSLFQTADQQSPFARAVVAPIPGATRNLDSIFNPHPDAQANADDTFNSAWASPFNHPEPQPKPTPEQLAAEERFHALMEPPVDKPAQSSGLFGLPAVTVDPNMQPAPVGFNPNGRSFTPLQDNIGRPTGLTPLPGITGLLPPPKKVAPLIQVPPWMQDPLQSPTMPQRQF